MGNSLGVVLDNYIGTAPIPCHLQLGETTSIDLSRDFEEDDAEVVKETFKVVYTVDKETCEVSFKRCGVDQHSNTEKDSEYVLVVVIESEKKECPTVSIKRNKSSDAWGGVVDTEVQLYENGRSWGLVVKETKKKRGEEEAEVATVAHYFVKSSGTDIGFSVVAKIGVSNEKFDVTVEGPEQHPVSALLYMFDEVYKTGTWKPTILTVKTVTVFPYQYLVPPPEMQEESPMVEGSRETLGASTSIDLSKDFEIDEAGMVTEIFKVLYTVDKETCEVSFIRYGDQHCNAQKVYFVVYDLSSFDFKTQFTMEITGTKYIKIVNVFWWFLSKLRIKEYPTVSTKKNKSFDAWGGVVDTEVQLYEIGRSWGLVVKESKKKRGEEEVEVATVAHYFVKRSGTSLHMSSGTDIGFSVVAKIGVSNGKFDIKVEGPEQHPVSALVYMFDEVKRTGIWKPTMCPHCHHRRRGKVFWQSDSEDSDSISIPVPRATPRNARGVFNGGGFQANGIGNFFENNFMIFPN
ncbi:hypothetical protein ACSQ67_009508 [Phaseolus vulgaris]